MEFPTVYRVHPQFIQPVIPRNVQAKGIHHSMNYGPNLRIRAPQKHSAYIMVCGLVRVNLRLNLGPPWALLCKPATANTNGRLK